MGKKHLFFVGLVFLLSAEGALAVFCALQTRLKRAWSESLGIKKPQACAWGFLGLEVRSGFEPL